jgi:hypothetical protein
MNDRGIAIIGCCETKIAGPYRLGDTRAVMIEGPRREAIGLLEIK